MNDYKYYSDLDSHPFTGQYNVNFKARIAQNDHVKKFFDGTAGVEQVQNVTPGKIYEIYKVEGYGDVADFYFKDDVGKEQCLADFFFGEVCGMIEVYDIKDVEPEKLRMMGHAISVILYKNCPAITDSLPEEWEELHYPKLVDNSVFYLKDGKVREIVHANRQEAEETFKEMVENGL